MDNGCRWRPSPGTVSRSLETLPCRGLRRHFAGLFRSGFRAYPDRDGDRSSGGPMPRQPPAMFRQVPKLFPHSKVGELRRSLRRASATPFSHLIFDIGAIVNGSAWEGRVNCFTLGQKINTEEADLARAAAARARRRQLWESTARCAKRSPAKQRLLTALLRSARLPFVSRVHEAKLGGSRQRNRSRPDARAGEIL